jgi:hypothetical protein
MGKLKILKQYTKGPKALLFSRLTRTSTDHLLPWVYPSVDYRPDFIDNGLIVSHGYENAGSLRLMT